MPGGVLNRLELPLNLIPVTPVQKNVTRAKVIQNIRNVYLRTCLKNDKDVREYVFFEMEFSSIEDLDEFAIFLKENNFIKPQQKKVLVFVNPVSGKMM